MEDFRNIAFNPKDNADSIWKNYTLPHDAQFDVDLDFIACSGTPAELFDTQNGFVSFVDDKSGRIFMKTTLKEVRGSENRACLQFATLESYGIGFLLDKNSEPLDLEESLSLPHQELSDLSNIQIRNKIRTVIHEKLKEITHDKGLPFCDIRDFLLKEFSDSNLVIFRFFIF